MFNESGMAAALKSVKKSLNESLEAKYGDSTKANAILRIHGLHKDYFDFVENAENIISSDISDVSIDVNANKNEKTMAGVFAENANPINKLVGFRYLYRKLKDMYGKEEAQKLMGEMYDYSLALSDSTKITVPYCFAIDASKLVLFGRNFGQLPSTPPKTMYSYIGALNETVHQISNHVAGAVAIGSFFLDVAHVLMVRESYQLEDLKNTKKRKYVENCFQSFVHSMNSLSRNAVESPFSNVSLFDRPKLETLISDMSFYFDEIDNNDLVIEFILELQRIFMEFFDRGDVVNGGKPFRFPVATINVSKAVNNGEIEMLDKDFIDEISKREIYRYNIMVSEGTKIASCCRMVQDNELMELGGQVNSFGGAGLSLGSHRVVTINFNRIALEAESEAHYFSIMEERIESAAKILEAHRNLLLDFEKKGLEPFMTNGWLNIDRMFSTFGVIGLLEAKQTMEKKFANLSSKDLVGDSLIFLNDKNKEIAKRNKNPYNIEQIPGESMAVKLRDVDELIFGDKVDSKIYANQFIPLWEDATIWERMKADGKYNKLYTGGGICHFNLGEKTTSKQNSSLISFASTSGCEHFALNSIYSQCEEGHTTLFGGDKCPLCGSQIIEKFTRVVGFFTPISSWNKVRREWEFPKRKFVSIE